MSCSRPGPVRAAADRAAGHRVLRAALAELSDDELDAGSLLPGWTRRHLRRPRRLQRRGAVPAGGLGGHRRRDTDVPSAEQRDREIKDGATLSAAALRNLFDHTVGPARRRSGGTCPSRAGQRRCAPRRAAPCPRRRRCGCAPARSGSTPSTSTTARSFDDFPDVVLESLLADIVEAWRRERARRRSGARGDRGRTHRGGRGGRPDGARAAAGSGAVGRRKGRHRGDIGWRHLDASAVAVIFRRHLCRARPVSGRRRIASCLKPTPDICYDYAGTPAVTLRDP